MRILFSCTIAPAAEGYAIHLAGHPVQGTKCRHKAAH